MTNILFVVDENRRGGVSVALDNVLNVLKNEECKLTILVLHDQGEMLKNLSPDIRVLYGTPFFKVIDYTVGQILATRNIGLILKKAGIIFGLKTGLILPKIRRERKKILKERYDVEVAFKDGFPAVFTACGETPRKIHWIHSEYKEKNSNSRYERLFKKILPRYEKIAAVSKGVEQQFNEIYHLEEKTEVIPNIVLSDKIKAKSLDEPIEYEKDKINVVLVGRCHPDKGGLRFLGCIKNLKDSEQLNNVMFHIIGDGPDYENMLAYISDNDLSETVKMYGTKDNPYRYMRNADCLFLPSVNESFGLVAVEAQILGIPVFATKTAATEELIKNNVNGLVVDNSEEGVITALLAVQERDKLFYFAQNVRSYVYDNEAIVSQIKEILGV